MRRIAHLILLVIWLSNITLPAFAEGTAPKPNHAQPPNPEQVAPAAAIDPTKPAGPITPTDPVSAVVRSFFDDQDPLILYFALPMLTFTRFVALFDLFNSVPNAWKAGAELADWNFNSQERKKVKAAIAELHAKAPTLAANLERSGRAYQKRLEEIEPLVRSLRKKGKIASDKHTLKRLDEAMEAWRVRADFDPLAAFVASERGRRLKFKSGPEWLTDFDTWSKHERREAGELVDAWNNLADTLNKGVKPGDVTAKLRVDDLMRNTTPGKVYENGITSVTPKEKVDGVHDRCSQVLKLLLDRRMEYRGKVGLMGVMGQGHKIMAPVGSLSFSGLVFWLHARAYSKSLSKYGTTPEVARAENAQRATIENAVTLRAESSLDSQVARRKDELQPFTEVVVDTLQDHTEELLSALKEYKRNNPDIPIDLNSKRAMLLDKDQLRMKVLQAMPFASQRIGKDLSVPQILSFLSLATKADTRVASEEDHKRFLNALYGRVLNHLFSEIESVVEVDDNLVTAGAGQHLSKLIKGTLTPATLPGMQKMKLAAPVNVTPLPVLPEKKPDPGAGKSVSQVEGSALPTPDAAINTAPNTAAVDRNSFVATSPIAPGN